MIVEIRSLVRTGGGTEAQPANYQPPVLIAEQERIGAGDGNRTHLAGLGMLGVRKHIRNRGNYLLRFETLTLTRRTHPLDGGRLRRQGYAAGNVGSGGGSGWEWGWTSG